MEKIYYYCWGCHEMISAELYDNGYTKCTREGCPFFEKPLKKILYCTHCHAYFPPGTAHRHYIPGIVHHHAPNRVSAVKVRI